MSGTVHLVDDDAMFRKAVCRLLSYAGFHVHAFGSPGEFLAAAPTETDACVLLDMAMPGLTGLDLQKELRARGNDLPILFLTGRADVPMTVQAMKRGAADFLTKPVDNAELLAAIRRALKAGRAARTIRAEQERIQARLDTLTPREREVLEHVVSGQLNKQIAADLGICERTIKVHRARVMEKMSVQSVAELARLTERARAQRPLP